MIKVLLLLVFIISISLSKSSIKLQFVTDDNETSPDLEFGVDENATFGLDEELGEIFAFDAPPPSPYYIFSLLTHLTITL